MKHMSKERWGKASALLRKSVEKDSLNVPAYYVLSNYYFRPQNPEFQVDSAHAYVTKAIRIWATADNRARLRWSKLPLDSQMLVLQRKRVDSAAFSIASSRNTEEAYNHYLSAYPLAVHRQAAIKLRNAVAFQKAASENTYRAFQLFIERYPEAEEVPRAKENYELRLFEYITRDGSLDSYVRFVREYPESVYRGRAERQIFQLFTRSGSASAFHEFLTKHRNNRFARVSANLLFHILLEEGREADFPAEFTTDSLSRVMREERDYLVPFLAKGRYGFMNSAGREVILPQFAAINEEYLCGNMDEDVIVLQNSIISRAGLVIWSAREPIDAIDDLGYGFLKVATPSTMTLVHKSGFVPVDFPIDEARVLGGKLLGLRVKRNWFVYSFSGGKMLPGEYEDVTVIGKVLVIQKGASVFLRSLDDITDTSTQAGPFDEARRFGDNIWVRSGEMHGLLDGALKVLIEPGVRTITPAFFGAVSVSDIGVTTINLSGEESELFQQVEVRDPWVCVKSPEGWVVYDPVQRIYKSSRYDSLQTYGQFAVGQTANGIEINMQKNPNAHVSLPGADRIEFLTGPDSSSYLLVEAGKKLSVYDQLGRHSFTGTYDRIQYAGKGYFIVLRKEKKGLVDATGKVILPVEYDAIGTISNNTISLLKAMKFGLYDVRKAKLIKPAFDKNIWKFNQHLYVAFKGSGLGFIDDNGKPVSGFDYAEVLPWTDTLAFVKTGTTFQLYEPQTKRVHLDEITALRAIRDASDEKIFIVTQRDQSGVVSNRKGIVIPVNFSEIVNVGSPDHPLYFTEKHVKEAKLFVVIYYDEYGKLIRREVYEPDEYDRIYCNN